MVTREGSAEGDAGVRFHLRASMPGAMVIGVLGGTGQTGREVVAELGRRGHRAIALSRTAPAGGEHRRVDVTSGEGLAEAMAGLDALVDVLQGGRPVLVDGVRRALAAARE